MSKIKPSITERKARFEKARVELEVGIIEKVTTAFYVSATLELMITYKWTDEQCKLFLDEVTKRAGYALALTEAHRQAREDEPLRTI